MKELELLYEGKSKQIYKTDSDNHVVIRFKDDTAAFYNIKRAIIEQKGRLTCDISSMVLDYLNRHNINTHFVERVGDDGQLCRVVEHIPVEVIVRNVVAGSMAKRLGLRRVSCLRIRFSTSAYVVATWAILLLMITTP